MDASTDSPPAVPARKPRQKRINHALAGSLLAVGCTLDAIAPQVGAKNGESLRTALARKGVTARTVRALQPTPERTMTVTAKIVEAAAEGLRDKLNGSLVASVDAFNSRPLRRNKLANKGQGDAAVLETLSRTWRNLNGSPDSVTFQFGAGSQSDMPQVEPASTPPMVSCGPALDVQATGGTPPVQVPES